MQDWCWRISAGWSQEHQQISLSSGQCHCCTGRWTGLPWLFL